MNRECGTPASAASPADGSIDSATKQPPFSASEKSSGGGSGATACCTAITSSSRTSTLAISGSETAMPNTARASPVAPRAYCSHSTAAVMAVIAAPIAPIRIQSEPVYRIDSSNA